MGFFEVPNNRSDSASAPTRRHFLSVAVKSAVLIPMAGMGMARMAVAADLPHLSPSDPTAKALSYVEVASESKSSAYKAGDACDNCALYQGDRKADWGHAPFSRAKMSQRKAGAPRA